MDQKARGGLRPSGLTAPPDGGWGWMIVAGCFLTTICTRAVTRCVSIFFVEFQLHFERDYSTTAWIHSLVDCMTMLCAPLGSFLGNRLSCRATVILGGLLSSTGLVVSSFATSLEYLYISLGVVTGLGFALCYTPAVAMVGTYFNERKALAYGIACSGSGIGTFVLAPAVQLLIERYSWRGALLILGGFVSNLCVCGALMRPLEPHRGKREQEDTSGERGGYMPAPLDSKDFDKVPPEYKNQPNLKHRDIRPSGEGGQHIANLKLEFSRLENAKVAELKPGDSLLSNRKSDMMIANVKLAEDMAVSNIKLTEKILAELKLSDSELGNGGTLEDMKLVEYMNLNNSLAKDTKVVDSLRIIEDKPIDVKQAIIEPNGKTDTLPLDSTHFVDTKTVSKSNCLCLRSMEEFGFLLMPDFLLLAVSFLFLAYGCSVPIVYLVPYALSVGVEHQHAAFLMAIFGIVGIVGNITFGWITDIKCVRKYRTLSFMLAVGLEGLCCMFIPLLRSFSVLVVFSMMYGYFDGAYVALIPVVTSDVVGSAYLTSALGVVYFLHAIPYLISPPIGGWLVDSTGDYMAAFYLSGLSLMLSPLFLATVMLVRRCLRTKSYSANDVDSTCQSLKNGVTDMYKASSEEPKLTESATLTREC